MAAKKKTQVSLEFMLILSFVVLMTVGFLYVIESRINDIRKSNDQQLVENFKEGIFGEINNAKRAMDGFNNQFFIPVNLGDQNYTMQIENNYMLTINYSNKEYAYLLPDNVTGSLNLIWTKEKTKYQINLTKTNGIVQISGS